MIIPFDKYHSAKNDFIILWQTTNNLQYGFDALRRQAPKLCSKDGDGIGADGIIICETTKDTDLLPHKIRIINKDGSIASMCGNGLRCAALSVQRRHKQLAKTSDEPPLHIPLALDHLESLVTCAITNQNLEEMGATLSLETSFLFDKELLKEETAWTSCKDVINKHPISAFLEEWHLCYVGNNHLILFCREPLQEQLWLEFAASMQQQPFWDGINVHAVVTEQTTPSIASLHQRLFKGSSCSNESFRVKVWERGVGPTGACGSGACSIVSSYLKFQVSERKDFYPVLMPKGNLFVQQTDEDGPILLGGLVHYVFSGTISI